VSDPYLTVRREGWFPRAMDISANLDAAVQMQTDAAAIWVVAAKTEDENGLRRADRMSQEAARVQAKNSKYVQTWLTETERKSSRKTRELWSSARDGLLMQSAGLLLELMVWERQLLFRNPSSQQNLCALNGQGIEHALYGARLIAAMKARDKESVVHEIAAEAHGRLKSMMDERQYLLTHYRVAQSRWLAWANPQP
jgi:hypothetical protein